MLKKIQNLSNSVFTFTQSKKLIKSLIAVTILRINEGRDACLKLKYVLLKRNDSSDSPTKLRVVYMILFIIIIQRGVDKSMETLFQFFIFYFLLIQGKKKKKIEGCNRLSFNESFHSNFGCWSLGEREREAKAIPSITSYINQIQESMSGSITVSNTKEKHPQYVSAVKLMFEDEEISGSVPEICNTKDFYSDLIRAHLKPQTILRGRVSCLLSITPAINVTISTFLSLFCFFVINFIFLVCCILGTVQLLRKCIGKEIEGKLSTCKR